MIGKMGYTGSRYKKEQLGRN